MYFGQFNIPKEDLGKKIEVELKVNNLNEVLAKEFHKTIVSIVAAPNMT